MERGRSLRALGLDPAAHMEEGEVATETERRASAGGGNPGGKTIPGSGPSRGSLLRGKRMTTDLAAGGCW